MHGLYTLCVLIEKHGERKFERRPKVDLGSDSLSCPRLVVIMRVSSIRRYKTEEREREQIYAMRHVPLLTTVNTLLGCPTMVKSVDSFPRIPHLRVDSGWS